MLKSKQRTEKITEYKTNIDNFCENQKQNLKTKRANNKL